MSHLLLVGSYTPPERKGLAAFAYDPASGALKAIASCGGIAKPSYLALHPNGRFFYAVSETSAGDGTPGTVWAFALKREPLQLEPLGHQRSGGDYPCHLLVDRGGRWLFVSNYSGGTLSVLPINSDGTLGPAACTIRHAGRGARPVRQDGPHIHASALDIAERRLVVTDLGLDRLMVYEFDGETGRLTMHASTAARPGAGPRHLRFHPGGAALYVVNELDSTVSTYAYNPRQGTLHELQTLATLPPEASESTAADVQMNSTADRLYVSNRGYDSIAVFAIRGDGRLEKLGLFRCGGRWPRSIALAPDNNAIVVANQRSDMLTVLPLQPDGAEVIELAAVHIYVPQVACCVFARA